MADLTITGANVLPKQNAKPEQGIAGEAVAAAGKSLYFDPVTLTYKLADANVGSPGGVARTPTHISMGAAAVGQPFSVCRRGRVAIGATVAVGTFYVQSATAGGICPLADLATGHTVTIIGYGVSTTEIELLMLATNVVVP